jgi:hypothetical protein
MTTWSTKARDAIDTLTTPGRSCAGCTRSAIRTIQRLVSLAAREQLIPPPDTGWSVLAEHILLGLVHPQASQEMRAAAVRVTMLIAQRGDELVMISN